MKKPNKTKSKKPKKRSQLLLPKPAKKLSSNKTKSKLVSKKEPKSEKKRDFNNKKKHIKRTPTKPTRPAKTKVEKKQTAFAFSLTFVVVISILFTILGGFVFKIYDQNVTRQDKNKIDTANIETTLASTGNVLGDEVKFEPAYVTPPPEVTATSYKILRNNKNGTLTKTMYAKNPDLTLQPASLTKIMTALVAMEDYPLDKRVVVPEKCTKIDGSKVGLLANDTLTLQDMLYGLLVHSGADAACAIANIYSEPEFVKQMNEKANELGLENTFFENEIGFDANNQQISSVNDITKMTIEALKSSVFRKIVGTPSVTLHSLTSKRTYTIQNTNELLSKIPGTVGIKTGYTEDAKGCLSYLYENPQTEDQILIILLGSDNQQTRFEDTQKLLNWAKQQITLLNGDEINQPQEGSSSNSF